MTRHRSPTAAFFVLFLILAIVPGGHAQKPAGGADVADYYPLQVGNRWDYKLTANGSTATMTTKIAKIETIDGQPLSFLEAFVNGTVVATEHLRRTDAGIERFRTNGIPAVPPFLLLKLPVKTEDSWSGEFTAGNDKCKFVSQTKEETVEVPAGKYKAIRVAIKLDVKGQTINITYWFARDVGYVKETVDAPNLNILVELQKFEASKAPAK